MDKHLVTAITVHREENAKEWISNSILGCTTVNCKSDVNLDFVLEYQFDMRVAYHADKSLALLFWVNWIKELACRPCVRGSVPIGLTKLETRICAYH